MNANEIIEKGQIGLVGSGVVFGSVFTVLA